MKPHKTISSYLPKLTETEKSILLIELLGRLPNRKLDELPHNNNPMWDNSRGYNQALDEVATKLVEFMEG